MFCKSFSFVMLAALILLVGCAKNDPCPDCQRRTQLEWSKDNDRSMSLVHIIQNMNPEIIWNDSTMTKINLFKYLPYGERTLAIRYGETSEWVIVKETVLWDTLATGLPDTVATVGNVQANAIFRTEKWYREQK